jgi:hypothetical protein
VVQTPVFDFEFAPVRIAQIERLKPIIAVIKATESHGANMLAGGNQGQVRSDRSWHRDSIVSMIGLACAEQPRG